MGEVRQCWERSEGEGAVASAEEGSGVKGETTDLLGRKLRMTRCAIDLPPRAPRVCLLLLDVIRWMISIR